MTDDTNLENESAKEQHSERRAYEAPAVRDFFQPLVVLGTGPAVITGVCATPKPPKH
jgi:hypothetical protein